MTKTLASEIGTVQFPLIKHAEEIGWTAVSDTEALRLRSGEAGLFFQKELEEALLRLNPGVVTTDNVQSIIQRMESVPNTIEGNREILEWLRGNRTIYDESEKRYRNVTLVDFGELIKNVYHVTYEWTFRALNKKGNRADVMFLVNGVPVAIVENKNPKLPDAMERAVKQLRRYELETPELLTMPQVFNVTHLIEYFYGVTWNYSRKNIFRWKEQPSETYKQAVQAFFDRSLFLAMLKEWILFFLKDDELQKTILRQHQTRAAVKVVRRCGDLQKKTGLIWHTQGSGKTFTLITAARLILENKKDFPGATVMVVVDRNELEGQLSGWIERLVGEMQGRDIKIATADSRARLQDILDQDFRGLIISMVHKFKDIRKDSCTRSDFFVLIDEAHRSMGGDLGNYLMGALPNATLIGFTGTPIDKTAYGKGTFKTFGKEDDKGYLDKYSIRESIEDGTTLKLRHTLAPSDVRLPDDLLEKEFFSLIETEGVSDIDELNRILDRAVHLKAFLKGNDRVEKVAAFIADHFKKFVEPLGYKAFVVAVDREACALYKRALDKHLPPEYSTPIYTKNAADAIDRPLVADMQLDESSEKKERKKFPKPDQMPKIFIVTDKLLTGYDAPILYCMYLDKPMRDHVLLQAVARVNRPYVDAEGVEKPCGLVIDFVGVLKELNKALAFDSDEVSGVIEDLDVLFARFKELMAGPGKKYLEAAGKGGGNDEKLDRLLYEEFMDKDKRQQFADFFKELETLYEILSPDPELRDHIEDYNRLVDIYVMLRNAYGKKTMFYGDIAHKTEMLVRDSAEAYLNEMTKTVEFDAAALEALKKKKGPDNPKIVNLVKSLTQAANERGEKEPYLISISDRAEAVMAALEDRQVSTKDAMERIEALMREKFEAEKARKESGLDPDTFEVFWLLKQEKLPDAEAIAKEITAAYERFPNYATNTDEQRQLKIEIYNSLLRVVSPKRMVDLTEAILRLRRQ
ncbi:MAG: HsdR family type I site-specific deoxyribonuclease [Candidatus Abyssobacteria bacterium SURF_5]|uniref:Type I restriction enzyme endonuclease subunit n=1 Tax=Abyssobacteria bacterium (strain SURF_5) TaxID=2093360 RepID=A0A3A4P542_ABYX5|nr:MAG: HsdR family type I site-specific deoxyribonuclease [Candidatus Abyssubacteria bacterium SURF_5]